MTRPQWLTRNLKVLSAVSLAQDAASELLYPILPILLTTVLGAPDAVVGIVEGLAEGVAAVTKYLAGRLSDFLGRKRLVGAGYCLAAVGKLVVAAAGVWPLVLLGRVVDRVGKGVRGAPRDALLAEGAPVEMMGRVFGFHRSADTLGAVVGPLLGLAVLAVSNGNIRLALWVALVPATISVALIPLVREGRPVRQNAVADATSPPVVKHQLSADYRRVVALLVAVSLVNFPDALILLRIHQVGFSAAAVVGAYALYNASYAVISYPAGALADRIPRASVYALGLACFAVGYIGLSLVEAPVAVLLLLVVYGGFNGCTDAVGKSWVSALAPAGMRGRAQGVFQGSVSGAILVAGLWAGLTWDIGPGHGVVPLVVAGCVTAISAVLLLGISPHLSNSA